MRIAVALKTAVALLVLGALAAYPCFAAQPKNIGSVQVKALLAKEKKILILDVRTPEEFRQARLHGALLIPLGELERRVQEVPRDRPILVYCSVGARSATAAGLLSARGYREVYQMSDGLVGWYNNGFPIER